MSKCFLCPNKGPIRTAEAIKCPGCNSLFHAACSQPERAGRWRNGSFRKCCGGLGSVPGNSSNDSSRSTSPSALNISGKIESLDDLWNKIDRKFETQEKYFYKKFDKKLDSISECLDVKNKLINDAHDRISALEEKFEEMPNASKNMDEMFSEFKDRMFRANNLMLFGLPEQTSDTPGFPNGDLIRVTSIISGLQIDETKIVNIRRIGKIVNGRNRPCIITFTNSSYVYMALSKKRNLPKEISISCDQTVMQRDHFKALKAEVDNHNKDHLNKRMVKRYKDMLQIIDVEQTSLSTIAKNSKN